MSSNAPSCAVRHMDHVGIAVANVEEALAVYRRLLDAPATPVIDAPELGIRAAIIAQGQTRIELLEPTDPDGPLARFISSRGEGLHHIALQVDDIHAKLAELKAAGIPLVDETPRPGLTGDIAFLRPEAVRNVLVELVQPPAPSPGPTGGLPASSFSPPSWPEGGQQGWSSHPVSERLPYRVLIAKPGLDGHERGARMVVRALQDAGFHVTYTGIRQTPDAIAEAARASQANVVGLSILSGAHLELVPRVLDALQRQGLDHLPVTVGGIIPDQDRLALLEMGVAAVFGPGARTSEIVEHVRSLAARRRAGTSG